VTTGAVIPKGF